MVICVDYSNYSTPCCTNFTHSLQVYACMCGNILIHMYILINNHLSRYKMIDAYKMGMVFHVGMAVLNLCSATIILP